MVQEVSVKDGGSLVYVEIIKYLLCLYCFICSNAMLVTIVFKLNNNGDL